MEPRTIEGGTTVYVDRDAPEVGSVGPFYPLYADPDGDRPYGYLCGNCETADNAMDTMGRIVCNECANTRSPEEWDAAHE